MPRSKTYFGGMNKTTLLTTIQNELKKYELNDEFSFDLLSDLILSKHYFCSAKGLRPIKFRMTPRAGGPYDFHGFFENHGWHKVSWRKCLSQGSELDWLKRALRDEAHTIIKPYRNANPICESCQSAPSEEVDHVFPEFNKMVLDIIGALTKEQISEAFKLYDWWKDEDYTLPSNHQARLMLHQAHKTAKLSAVCHRCHVENSRIRKVQHN